MKHLDFQEPADCNPNPEPLEEINADDDPFEEETVELLHSDLDLDEATDELYNRG